MSHAAGDEFSDSGDVAPGPDGVARQDLRSAVLVYLLGFALATLLTILSFYIASSGLVWRPALPMALSALAVSQIGVHLVFFMHLTTSPDNTNNVLALAFGILIVFLVVLGSIWIMDHLNQNMDPMMQMQQMQQMQR